MGGEICAAASREDKVTLLGGNSSSIIVHGNNSGKKFTVDLLSNATTDTSIIIDASTVEANLALLHFAEKTKQKKNFLICTTGLDEKTIKKWQLSATKLGHTVLFAPNTSVGILLMRQIIASFGAAFAKVGFTPAIFEIHHGKKKDSPSGTAKSIQSAVKKSMATEAQMAAIRGGGNFGEHSLMLLSDGEEIRLEHRALSRKLFGTGALRLANWLTKQKSGFYELDDVAISEL